jgi:hypothetical protein
VGRLTCWPGTGLNLTSCSCTSGSGADGIVGFVSWRGLDICQPITRLVELVLVDQHGVADSMGTSL